jgi:hypothetical protein
MHRTSLWLAGILWTVCCISYASYEANERADIQDFKAFELRMKEPGVASSMSTPWQRDVWGYQAIYLASGGLALLFLAIGAWQWWLEER